MYGVGVVLTMADNSNKNNKERAVYIYTSDRVS